MDAATLGVCAPNIVARRVQRLRVSIAKGARGAFRVPGSVTYRCWPLYCSSRVMGNYHARFLGGWARATAPGYPPRARLSVEEPVGRVKRRLAAATGCSARLSGHFRAGANAEMAVRGQAGGGRHEPARRRTRVSGGGSGYQLRRWSNSKAGADWSSGSAAGSCSASVAAHSGGPRAGAMRGGAVGSPRWSRMSRTVGPLVMKAMILIAPPQPGHSSGKTSSMRASSSAQA